MFTTFWKGSRNDARKNWSDDQWMDHLLEQALSESERQEIYAIFATR